MLCYNIGMFDDEILDADEEKLRSHEDVDWVVVERALSEGFTGPTTIGDREAIVREGHRRGLNDLEIARLTKVLSARGVLRIRKRLGLPPQEQVHKMGLNRRRH